MGINIAAGASLEMKAAQPATFNPAGYGALTSWTLIGEIENLPEFGRKYNLAKHVSLKTRATVKKKGSFDEGAMDIPLALDTDDAGQILAKSAAISDNDYSFKLTLPGGDVYYWQAQVMSFTVTPGGVDDFVKGTMRIELTTNSPGVGIVEVLA